MAKPNIQKRINTNLVLCLTSFFLSLSNIAVAQDPSEQPTVDSLSTPEAQAQITEGKPQNEQTAPIALVAAAPNTQQQYQLTLEQVLLMTQEANPGLKASSAQTDLAKAKYLTSLAKMLPDLELGYTDTNFNGTMNMFGQLRNLDYQFRQPQMVFKFPVFQGGRRFLQARSSKKLLNAQKQNEAATQQVTLQQAAITYYNLTKALQAVSFAEQTLKEAEEQLNINEMRIEAGVGTQLDVLQSKAQKAHANQQLTEALNTSQIAAARLNEILDLPALAITKPDNTDAIELNELVPQTLDANSLMQKALEKRPELKVLEQQIAAIEAQRTMALTVILPDINVQLRSGAIGERLDSLAGFDETNIGLNLTLPNLGASALTLYKEKTAEIKQLKAQKESLKNKIERELAEAFLNANSQKSRYDAAKLELEAAEEALVFATERLKVGVGRNIDVLDAQTKLSNARTNLNNIVAESNQAQINLVSALGLASVKTLTQGINP